MLPILEARRRARRRRLLPRLRARARRPGQRAVHDPAHAEAGRRRDRRVPAPHRAALRRDRADTVVPCSSTMVAETAKLHENTFRAVNIALANELALMCDKLGISAWEVIEAASTKPFGFLPHYPGPGLGGDCIPVVPHFLAWRLREYGYSAQLIEAAHEVNARMPHLRRAEGRRRAQRRGPADQGLADPAARRGVQGRRRTTRASRRASRSCASCSRAAATSATATRGSPEFELDGGPPLERRVVAPRSRATPTASSC